MCTVPEVVARDTQVPRFGDSLFCLFFAVLYWPAVCVPNLTGNPSSLLYRMQPLIRGFFRVQQLLRLCVCQKNRTYIQRSGFFILKKSIISAPKLKTKPESSFSLRTETTPVLTDGDAFAKHQIPCKRYLYIDRKNKNRL